MEQGKAGWDELDPVHMERLQCETGAGKVGKVQENHSRALCFPWFSTSCAIFQTRERCQGGDGTHTATHGETEACKGLAGLGILEWVEMG